MSDEVSCCGACGHPLHTTKSADRIEQLVAINEALTAELAEAETKLAKAVEAASPLLNMYAWTESAEDAEMVIISVGTVRRIRTTLAEIEGGKA